MTSEQLRKWWQVRRADLGALALLTLAFCLAFGWALFRGKFLIGGDVFFYTYPMRTVAWNMIRAGTWPIWTPLVFSGYPLLAMVQLGLGYPLTWTHLFLPHHWAEEILVLAPFLLAPAFTYAYAREMGRSRLAALLAGLVFGYSGLTTNTLGMNGIPINAMIWLPLILIALERSRKGAFLPAVFAATAAYTLTVLSGHAQSFLLVGLAAGLYALFLALAPLNEESIEPQMRRRKWLTQKRWRPLFVIVLSLLLSLGLAAFQLLETLRAARRSIRHSIAYDFFSQGSFTPREALLSFAAPLYHYIDVTTYVAPLACALAIFAVVEAARRRRTADPRIWLWLAVAGIALVFVLGEHTPLFRLVYQVPILNLFRMPSRHVFEWSFAIAMLAAYGWDALGQTARAGEFKDTPSRWNQRAQSYLDPFLLALCAVLGALWFLSVNRISLARLIPVTQSGRGYFTWKILLTAGVLLVVWRGRLNGGPAWRKSILTCALMLGCLVEPVVLISQWWPGTAKPAARFTTPGKATRYLQQFPPEANRVYTHANLGVDENSAAPRFDVLNQAALYGMHNAAGYEPLLLERYSRALGNVDYDAVRPRAGYAPPRELFGQQSLVLDLLNVTHVVAFSDLAKLPPPQLTQHEGISFAADELAPELKPGESMTISADHARGDTLAMVTSLANSVEVAQDGPVARLRLHTSDGRIVERQLLAGRDTAEWAHERPDVRSIMKHKLAPVFDSRAGDDANSFPAQRYWTRLPLGGHTSIGQIEITNTLQTGTIAVWKVTLYDGVTRQSTPFSRPVLDPLRWRTAAEFDGVLVLRNTRALPRAWLVTQARTVDGEEALRLIRGEGSERFDPHRSALVEAGAEELPRLAGDELPPESIARVVKYESNRLTIETIAPTPTLLVVSEIFYPGWEATVDGQPAQILLTDYLLRGVSLPAGPHKVEMHYAAPAARNGAIITSLTFLLLGGLAVFARRRSVRP